MAKKVKMNEPSVDGKVQGDPETLVASSAQNVGQDMADQSFVTEKSNDNGSTLKQERVAKVLQSSASGAPTVSGGVSRSSGGRASSGSTDGALGTSNATPIGGNTRRDSRFDKKVEKVATKINFTPSEQYEKAYVEAKPLAQSADKVQGYNGTYRNETYRTQKIAGTSPAELNYDRSVDFIEKDQVYFLMGQQIFPSALAGSFDPSRVWDIDSEQYVNNGNRINRGNYIPRLMNFQFRKVDGVNTLIHFSITTEAINPTYSRDLIQAEAANAQMEINKVEIYREKMENNAGDESKEGWCPLSKAVDDPNGWLALLHAYEGCLGGETLFTLEKFSNAHSFQMNRAAKDGQDINEPIIEAFIGAYEACDRSTGYGSTVSDIWGDQAIADGSAGSFIKAYDSVSKYNTKSDFLIQPRSLKMHYVTGRNSFKEFYADPRFIKAVANTECYATYGYDYDPTLPVLMTDKAALVYPFDLAQVSEFRAYDLINQTVDVDAYTGAEATAGFADFDQTIYINQSGSNATVYYKRALKTGGTNDGSYTTSTDSTNKIIYLIANSTVNGADAETLQVSDTNFSGASSITVPDDYALVVRAPHDGFETHKRVRPIGAAELMYAYHDVRNIYHVKVRNPLIDGIVRYLEDNLATVCKSYAIGTRYSLPIMHSSKYFCVWEMFVMAAMPYIQEQRINYMRDILHYTDSFGYPFEDLENCGTINHIPFKYLTSKGPDEPLGLGKLSEVAAVRWTMPEFFWDLGIVSSTYHKFVAPWYICENDYHWDSTNSKTAHDSDNFNMCWPSTRAGIKLDALVNLQNIDERQLRLALDMIVDVTDAGTNVLTDPRAYKYGRSTDGQLVFKKNNGLSIRELLRMPRQLGFVMDAPGGMLTAAINTNIKTVNWDGDLSAVSSFRAVLYTNVDTSANKDILSSDGVNVNRAANFKQVWNRIDLLSPSGSYSTPDYGVLLGISMAFDSGSPRTGKALFKPYGALATGAQDDASIYPVLFASHRYLYARTQQLPFIISPFDAVDAIDGGSSHCDIYDFAYIFGLCGFRASDYNEDVYNRQNEIFNRGYTFVSDPWYESSEIAM